MKKPEPKYIINVQIGWDVAEKLDIVAHSLKVTRTALVRTAIERLLAGYTIKAKEVPSGAKS
jgi:predicted transcriptional regulator